MPQKPKTPTLISAAALKPVVAPLIKPLVEPVLSRLDRHEALLAEMKAALEVQFKRTAAVQAQLDQILGVLAKSRR